MGKSGWRNTFQMLLSVHRHCAVGILYIFYFYENVIKQYVILHMILIMSLWFQAPLTFLNFKKDALIYTGIVPFWRDQKMILSS